MNIDDIMAGLATAIRAIDGLNVHDFPAARVEPPAVVMELPTIEQIAFQDGAFSVDLAVWLLISKADDRASAKELLPYIAPVGERSIKAAIEADRTLGGVCDSVSVLAIEPTNATLAGTEFLAAQFTVEVI